MIEKLEKLSVSKPAITRLFALALVLVVAGFASSIAIGIWALVNGAVAFGGPTIVTVEPATFASAVVVLAVAALVTGIGTAVAVVAWACALLNTARLEDKAWFVALLGLGLISLGWVALIAYVIYGPDSTQAPARVPA